MKKNDYLQCHIKTIYDYKQELFLPKKNVTT